MMSGIPLIGGAEGICGDAPGPIIQTHGAKHRGAAPASDHSLRQRRLLASWEAASLTADETTSGTVPSSTIRGRRACAPGRVHCRGCFQPVVRLSHTRVPLSIARGGGESVLGSWGKTTRARG